MIPMMVQQRLKPEKLIYSDSIKHLLVRSCFEKRYKTEKENIKEKDKVPRFNPDVNYACILLETNNHVHMIAGRSGMADSERIVLAEAVNWAIAIAKIEKWRVGEIDPIYLKNLKPKKHYEDWDNTLFIKARPLLALFNIEIFSERHPCDRQGQNCYKLLQETLYLSGGRHKVYYAVDYIQGNSFELSVELDKVEERYLNIKRVEALEELQRDTNKETYQEKFFDAFYKQSSNLLRYIRSFEEALENAGTPEQEYKIRKNVHSKLKKLSFILINFRELSDSGVFTKDEKMSAEIEGVIGYLDKFMPCYVEEKRYIPRKDINHVFAFINDYFNPNTRKRKLLESDDSFDQEKRNQKTFPETPKSTLDSSLFNSSGNLDVNINYQYEDNDIQAILFARLQQLRIQNPKLFIKPIEIRAAIDNIFGLQLEGQLRQGARYQGAYICLIPCNLGNAHWVGILLEFGEKGEVRRAEYIDSSATVPIIPETFKEQLKRVYPEAYFQTRTLSQQHDSTSCGAYTIENLLISALNISSPEESSAIRSLHLESLRQYNPDFYSAFNKRQRNNRPTTADLQEQIGHLERLKGVWLSKPELNRILAIKQLLSCLPEEAKTELLQAFKPNLDPADIDDHGLHLNIIRIALQKSLRFESKALAELMELLFENWSPAKLLELDKLNFRVSYNEILAITESHLLPEKMSNLQRALAEQINEDTKFALKLQAELWSCDASDIGPSASIHLDNDNSSKQQSVSMLTQFRSKSDADDAKKTEKPESKKYQKQFENEGMPEVGHTSFASSSFESKTDNELEENDFVNETPPEMQPQREISTAPSEKSNIEAMEEIIIPETPPDAEFSNLVPVTEPSLSQQQSTSSTELTQKRIDLTDICDQYKPLCKAINNCNVMEVKGAVKNLGFTNAKDIKIYHNKNDTLGVILAASNISNKIADAIREAMEENKSGKGLSMRT